MLEGVLHAFVDVVAAVGVLVLPDRHVDQQRALGDLGGAEDGSGRNAVIGDRLLQVAVDVVATNSPAVDREALEGVVRELDRAPAAAALKDRLQVLGVHRLAVVGPGCRAELAVPDAV